KTGVSHVEGCDTSAISGLTYSETAVTITAAQLSTSGGSESDTCGLSTTAEQASETDRRPNVVTRPLTAKDVCLNTTSKMQTIEVDLPHSPTRRSSDLKTGVSHVEGCDTSAISGLTYSESAVTITAAQLSTAGGSASDTCGLSSITYQDSKTGSCPIVVTRTFTAKDVCLDRKTKRQTTEDDDTIAPS